jgi:hypothetical protein
VSALTHHDVPATVLMMILLEEGKAEEKGNHEEQNVPFKSTMMVTHGDEEVRW